MWLCTIDYTVKLGGWLIGTGAGEIGSAAGRNEGEGIIIYSNIELSAANVVFVLIFPILGISAFAFITIAAISAMKTDFCIKKEIAACFILGMGQAVVAGTLTAIFFGAACGLALAARRRPA